MWPDLDDVRASQKHQALRQQLHERFDQWLDALERQLPEAELTLDQVSETIWGCASDSPRAWPRRLLSTAIKANNVDPLCAVRRVRVC